MATTLASCQYLVDFVATSADCDQIGASPRPTSANPGQLCQHPASFGNTRRQSSEIGQIQKNADRPVQTSLVVRCTSSMHTYAGGLRKATAGQCACVAAGRGASDWCANGHEIVKILKATTPDFVFVRSHSVRSLASASMSSACCMWYGQRLHTSYSPRRGLVLVRGWPSTGLVLAEPVQNNSRTTGRGPLAMGYGPQATDHWPRAMGYGRWAAGGGPRITSHSTIAGRFSLWIEAACGPNPPSYHGPATQGS